MKDNNFLLMEIMDKKIISFWLLIVPLLTCSAGAQGIAADSSLKFTEAEQEWIQKHPVIRVANESDWPPFDFNEAGVAKGLCIDHIKLLADKVGVEIEFVHGYSWTELLALFKQRKIDVMPVVYENAERKTFTLFTKPYYRGKLGIFINSDEKTWSMNLGDKRVGMETSHGSIPIVKERIAGIQITEVDSNIELVRKLSTTQLDAIIGNPFVFHYLAKEQQINNIKLAKFVNMTEEEQRQTSLHVGVRNDWPILQHILQKAMDKVSTEEMAEIENKWANVSIVEKINWLIMAQIALVVALIVAFLVWHNRRLTSVVQAKTEELKSLNEDLEVKVAERTQELTEVNVKLNTSLEELQTLRGIIPICSACKKIRDDSGYWNRIEAYIAKHTMAQFSHGMCPDCAKELYPDLNLDFRDAKSDKTGGGRG